MSIVGKRAEISDPRNSFAAATFRKVLKGFEIGGLPYTEVQFQLKRLLATGVSPGELREVLRRSELIEPLPEYAYREVLGLLDEAIEQGAAQQGDLIGPIDQEENLDPAALAAELQNARAALEAEQIRARESDELLSERIAAEEELRSRLDTALRDSERYQAELRAARGSMASRDKVTAHMRQTLDERDAQLAGLRREHAELAAVLESRSSADAAELAAARAALDQERRKNQDIERSLTDSNSLSGAAREALASRDRTLAELRQTLAQRDEQLGALRREQAERQSNLQSSRAQAASLVAELDAARAALESERRRNHKATGEWEGRARDADEKLQAAQKRTGAAKADLDDSRAQIASLQTKLRDDNALIEKLAATVRIEAQRASQWQAVVQQQASEAGPISPRAEVQAPVDGPPRVDGPPGADSLPRVDVPRRVQVQRRLKLAQGLSALAEFPLNVRGWRRNFRTPPGALWIGAAIVLLAAAIGFGVWRPPPTPTPITPAPSVAAAIQPGTTIRDCPTCPVLTVLPTGRFEQGSAPTENGSAFEKPLHWVLISHPIALSINAVTVDEFREFVAATGRDMQGCDTYDGEWRHRAENNWENPGFVQTGSHPVTCTSWNDANAYATWLSAKTGQHYRLPSASEWEYAARAGGAAAQPWSDGSGACANANVADQSAGHRYPGWAVFACSDGFVQTAPVGSFKANSFGLNDMLGNVFQWTEDCWSADYKGAPVDGAPRSDGDCAERELRGGSWFSTPAFVRANYRNHFGVDYRTSSVGIRLARDIAP
jgi:formylglycine-generating enzyme required for sulfatase activity